MKCKDCQWYVVEKEIGRYLHKKEEGAFCLIQDFFTNVGLEDEACKDFVYDGGKEEL